MICHYDPTVGVYRILSIGDHFSHREAKMERNLYTRQYPQGKTCIPSFPPHITRPLQLPSDGAERPSIEVNIRAPPPQAQI
jgi:hypothetical protein